jgi:hypothetical protein
MPVFDVRCKSCDRTKEILTLKINTEIKASDCLCGVNDWEKIVSVSHSKNKELDSETRQTEDMCDSRWT